MSLFSGSPTAVWRLGWFGFCLGLVLTGRTQEAHPVYTHYTVEDGLPSSEVYQALQASDGHLWFATDHGVSRYDGYSFQTYTTDNGLCDQVVFCMHEDARQRLWFATYSGCMFYYENGQFAPFQWNDALQAALRGAIINGIWVDDQDTVWLDLNRGRSIKVTPDGEVLHIYPKNNNPHYDQEVHQIGEGAYIFDRGERYASPEDPEIYQTVIHRKGGQEPVQFTWSGFPESGVIWGIPMRDGGIAVSWGHRLMRWRAATGTATEVGLPASQTISLMEDRKGDLWVGMRNRGAYCFPGGDPSAVPEHYLDGKAVSSVLQDHEGNYWLTTLDDGIYLLRSKAIRLYNREGGLSSQHMVGVAGTKHAVWAGTYLGDLFRVPITGDDSLTATFMGQFGQFGTIRSAASGALLTNADGLKVRICGEASGKVERLPEGELIAPYYPQGEVIFLENTVHHIIRILLRNDSVIHHETTTPSPAFVARTFCTDASGLHWVGALDGLYSWNDETRELTSWGERDSLLRVRVGSLAASGDGRLFVGTRGEGVLIKDGDRVHRIDRSHGILDQHVRSLFLENDSTVWVTGKFGINRVVVPAGQEASPQVSRYTIEDGLPTNEVNQIYVNDNVVWAATNLGLIRFRSDLVESTFEPPKLLLRGVVVNGRDTALQQDYTFNHTQNYLRFNYIGLCYKDLGNLRYRYRLMGTERGWTYTSDTSAYFAGLPPGKYHFVVTALNSRGGWSEEANIAFTIRPPFWNTWWFISLGLIAFGGTISGFFLYRIRQLRRRERLHRQMDASRHQAFQAQMNPHFIFNSLNAIHHYILEHNADASSRYLAKFAKLMRTTLDHSRESLVSLEEELKALRQYLDLEHLRFEGKLQYTLEVEPGIDTVHTLVPAVLIQPFLENAIWHGIMNRPEGGNVALRLHRKNQHIICTIEDDGVGREQARVISSQQRPGHKSAGLAIMDKRIALIRSIYRARIHYRMEDLYADDGSSKGTRVLIRFPDNLEHYKEYQSL